MEKISSFKDLIAWKEGHKLAVTIYEITKAFPKEEIFGLTNQIRRAAVSVTSNIAEGFSRNSSKEKIQFYSIALGSLSEVQSQILIAKDIGYFAGERYDSISQLTITVSKLLNGLARSAQSHPHNT
ncbi:MAG: hypothetical protein A2754_03415 [Candidatus Magasanikbacteria bacterium RIFCSPHIGHO2_01_FULL_47_8]|uniref:Four helix bundle protein n=1 Tax=Candidatus Magasanikbacteria bacterium RIFCSPHIGHO2_01_FULL_47_8 TaxID=1798673 RepID=A0A1F6MAX3_9BACT|nr:MAG: hypothetical protein A2754_03415 [Candidatus Magasanikbacteria bacterium RIFCSPHIGHO2_01_FULL_47_8]